MIQTDFSKRKYFIIVLITSCVLLSTFTFALYRQAGVMESNNDWVLHSYEIIRINNMVLNDLVDMETGQRGYLLTGRIEFLAPYESSVKTVRTRVKTLEEMVAGDEEQEKRLSAMLRQINVVKKILSDQISRYYQKGSYSLTVEDMKKSKDSMDSVRSIVEKINAVEVTTLKDRLQLMRDNQHNYFIMLFVGCSLAIGGLLIANSVIIALIFKGRRTQQDLQESETRYGMLLQGINDGIYELDPRSGIMKFSPSYKILIGLEPSEMPVDKQDFMRLVHPDDAERVQEEAERYRKHETDSYSTVFRLRHKNGSYLWILSRGVAEWDAQGNIKRMFGTHTDITAQKASEEQLKQINSDLESFTYIASHDLRAPLVNLKGFATEIQYSLDAAKTSIENTLPTASKADQDIIRNALETDIPESLEFIRTAVRKMDKITNAILDLSRIGRRTFRPEPQDTNHMVKRCIDSQSFEISSKNIEITYQNLPEVIADGLALEQVISNILDNAIKYLEPGKKGSIIISATELPGETMFCVKDNGRGISETDKKKVFDIFRRASNVSDVRGSGMGMAYVKATLRRMGGRIWFHSTLGEGTSFYFTLPHKPQLEL